MPILNNSFSVFWKSPKTAMQFQGDMFKFSPEETAREIASRYARLFPNDVICSIRDKSGKFQAFKGV